MIMLFLQKGRYARELAVSYGSVHCSFEVASWIYETSIHKNLLFEAK
ncbi:hypothetical protein gpAD87_24255 [Paenibacillus sp. AD87]|nr:hypothetical protein gpAD87_24255 [Paenibacillus sp. AD87]SLK22809.1 hypothetical protein SAMN06272722_12537 [Paenibacillus sp. RU5A]SOC77435.1 hypothetical protein SAMN05880581_12537 [Paenibacillus sp. RU26A]